MMKQESSWKYYLMNSKTNNTESIICKTEICKMGEKSCDIVCDWIIRECHINLYIEDRFITTFQTIEREIPELILGYMKTELNFKVTDMRRKDLNYSVSGRTEELIKDRENQNRLDMSNSQIMKYADDLLHASDLFQKTGNMHAAFLITAHNRFYSEDIGRHNAIDKVIGKALKIGESIEGGILFTSGRAPSDMIKKCLNTKIKTFVSRSAPTEQSIEFARQNKISLFGFARRDRINIYTDYRES